VNGAVQSFLLALSALFSIVNPIGSALIFSQVTTDRTHEERRILARRIAIYSVLVMLGALWGGAYVLNFFGVSLAALRIAGGFVVASSAWILLQKPEANEERKAEQASHAEGEDDVAFYPLTMPFTTGPGTIAVAIAIGSNLPVGRPGFWSYFLGASLAAVAIAAMVLVAYRFADRLVALLGPQQARVVTRLAAFLLLCVGVQIALSGVAEFVGELAPAASGGSQEGLTRPS
jgi:multiple antibiotic resistance protein